MTRPTLLVAIGWLAGALGCGPTTVSMTMPTPARATETIEAKESYDIPPYGKIAVTK